MKIAVVKNQYSIVYMGQAEIQPKKIKNKIGIRYNYRYTE